MKLSRDSINKLDALIQTSMVAGIKKLVIEGGKIRGIDEKQQVVIITTNNVPDTDGKHIGITRLDSLAARLNLVKNQGQLEIEATEAINKIDIAQLDLSAGKVKAQFRCSTNSGGQETIKGVPKNVADVLVWEIKIDSKTLPIITQAVNAMSAEALTIASKDGKIVGIELIDTNKDIFSTEMSDGPIWIGSGTPKSSFCHKYPAKAFVSLIKEALKGCDTLTMQLGEGGILSLKVNEFDFFILPTQ
jgi:hypothetical protein